jgi:hypothetical protein
MAQDQLTRRLRRDYSRLKLRFENAPTRLPLLATEESSERRMLGRLKLRKRTLLERSAR